jgi:hypothetical protein
VGFEFRQMGFEFENRRARTISEPQKSFQLVGDERGVGFRPFFFEFGRGRVVQKMGANRGKAVAINGSPAATAATRWIRPSLQRMYSFHGQIQE